MTEPVKIAPEVSRAVSFQAYAPQPHIQDVVYHKLAKHRALEGSFMEYLRLTEGAVENLPVSFTVRQVSVSRAVPNRVNAFHIHPKAIQDELWCVVDGTLLVWLVDCREGSPTYGVKRSYVLSGEDPVQLYIPSGVAHGYKAGAGGALLVYAMNSQFNAQDANEGRLPWDYYGREIWEDDRG